MKANKYYVRFIGSDEAIVCSSQKLFELILDCCNFPMRVVPLDSDDSLVHEESFLVGDEYSLSFLFNDKTI